MQKSRTPVLITTKTPPAKAKAAGAAKPKAAGTTQALRSTLGSVCLSQLRVGAMGFGGPLATMAYMRDELIEKKGLLPPERFLEGLAVVKLLPGPVSTLLAVFLGQEIAGPLCGFLSGLCYILPAFFMVLAIAVFERALGEKILGSTYFLRTMAAVQVAVISVILFTCWKLLTESFRRRYSGSQQKVLVCAFTAAAMILSFFHAPELLILLGCAGTGLVLQNARSAVAARKNAVPLLSLFLTFLYAGVTVFGTGFMVLPYLQRTLVTERGWLSTKAFLDGVAYGNLTPGPIVIASTYFGYHIEGVRGALVATVGIFAGPIVLMLCLGPLLKKILGRPWVEGALLGLLPAVAATIAMSLIPLATTMTWNPWKYALLAVTLALCLRKWAGWKVLLLAAAAGLVHAFI